MFEAVLYISVNAVFKIIILFHTDFLPNVLQIEQFSTLDLSPPDYKPSLKRIITCRKH